MKSRSILGLTLAAVTLLIFSGCQETSNVSLKEVVEVSEDAVLAESLFNELFNDADEESKSGEYSSEVGKTSYKSAMSDSIVLTFNNNGGNWPKSLHIDYGNGVTVNGVEKRGSFTISYSDRYRNPGSVSTITPDNLHINEHRIEGTKTITNNGRDATGQLMYTVEVKDGVITKPGGGRVTWESIRTNVWTEGEPTTVLTHGIPGICDDVYEISGYGEGVSSSGHTYRLDIEDPLVKQICCYYVKSGSIRYSINGNSIATVDYGDGSCDPVASLEYDGEVHVVVIR